MIIVQKIKTSVAKADARLLDRVRGLQHTVPSQSLESPSGFSISARVNFHFVFWLPKFEILREINADLISGSKHLFLFAGFF